MASTLRPVPASPPGTGRVVKDATRSEVIEKNLAGLNELLAVYCQRLGGVATRLTGPWPSDREPKVPAPETDGNHAVRVDNLMNKASNLLSELEAITVQLERYV